MSEKIYKIHLMYHCIYSLKDNIYLSQTNPNNILTVVTYT